MTKTRWLCLLLALCCLWLGGCARTEAPSEQQVQIHTVQQLLAMEKTGNYILMTDLDLAGQSWQPLDFAGRLDGNGKILSNLTLAESTEGRLGLFGCLEGTVENLHLADATLTAGEDAQFAGLLAGINRGVLRGCTVTGSIADNRPDSCLGVLVGFNDGGRVESGTKLLSGSAGSSNPQDRATGLSAVVSLNFPEDRAGTVGMAGKTEKGHIDPGLCWQDTTGSFSALPEQEQQRRQAVVDMMHRMGTVRWTPSEELRYTANDNRKSVHSNAYLPGRTYVGIPYNGCEGAYERFMTQMQPQTDDQGRLVTVTGLEDGIKTKDGQVSGFILNMGNDCVGAVIWALAAGVPYSVEDQGVAFSTPVDMVPNRYNAEHFGALPAGGYRLLPSDEEKYPDGLDARDTKAIIDLNGGAEAFAEYYAKAYRGDYLICIRYVHDPETDTWKKTANHGRVLAYEPVIVRSWDGRIDLEESYVITHEQGDGLYDNRLEDGQYETYEGYNLKQTSWRTDYKYSLSLLLTEEGYNSAYLPGTGYGYVPATVAAYSQQAPLAEFVCREMAAGVYEANYLMTSATMTIADEQGEIVYEKTAYLPYRVFAEFTQLRLEELFPDVALTAGKTYYRTVTATATGGRSCTVAEAEAFTQ